MSEPSLFVVIVEPCHHGKSTVACRQLRDPQWVEPVSAPTRPGSPDLPFKLLAVGHWSEGDLVGVIESLNVRRHPQAARRERALPEFRTNEREGRVGVKGPSDWREKAGGVRKSFGGDGGKQIPRRVLVG